MFLFFLKKHATNQTHWVSVEDGRLGAVIGVVSKNYNSNDFITGYGADSGIAFQHVGDTDRRSASTPHQDLNKTYNIVP